MQNKFLSLRAVHILGQLNLGADLHLRDELRPREWSLHPQTGRFSRAEVDLFHFIRDSPLLLWFSLSHLLPLGIGNLAHVWQRPAYLLTKTILNARAPSTRWLYAFKGHVFLQCKLDQVHCGSVQSFSVGAA